MFPLQVLRSQWKPGFWEQEQVKLSQGLALPCRAPGWTAAAPVPPTVMGRVVSWESGPGLLALVAVNLLLGLEVCCSFSGLFSCLLAMIWMRFSKLQFASPFGSFKRAMQRVTISIKKQNRTLR